ncbi:GNAT family N-acetyltransferase [Actinoplanes sp. NPDC023801]|uniref:GNAT family N-acetyltransferase n=1 Tax=Actinoplanes sp. NPDC023801 TaxID=3154595 RepID=UPI0033F1CABA
MAGTKGAVGGRLTTSGTDVQVEMLDGHQHLEAAARLLWEVWGARTMAARDEVINTSLLRGLRCSGNYVAGAYHEGRLVGCTVGFFGARALHSHLAGVVASHRDRGVGFAMKCHQRQFALDQGFDTITWTSDPLLFRNAYFNLCKLGATAVAYEPDFYGRIDDGTNTDQHTDRLLMEWRLHAGWPAVGTPGKARFVSVVPSAELIHVPRNIDMLRDADPGSMERARTRMRAQFVTLLAEGYTVAGMSKAGAYVLLPAGVTPEYESSRLRR